MPVGILPDIISFYILMNRRGYLQIMLEYITDEKKFEHMYGLIREHLGIVEYQMEYYSRFHDTLFPFLTSPPLSIARFLDGISFQAFQAGNMRLVPVAPQGAQTIRSLP